MDHGAPNKRRKGNDAGHESVPPGPKNLKEMFQWPASTFESSSDKEKIKFSKNWADGTRLRTQYSGMGCVEQAMMLAEYQLKEKFGLSSHTEVLEQFDIVPLCRNVLLSFPASHRGRIVTGDILHRLPSKVRGYLACLQWPPRPSRPGVKGEEITQTYVESLRDWQRAVNDVVREAKPVLNCFIDVCFQPNSKVFCFRRDQPCEIGTAAPEIGDGFDLTVAGTTCLDWSYMGDRLGSGGPSMLPFLVWLAEQKARKVPAILHECTPGFRNQLIKDELTEQEYESHDLVVGPEHMGVPCERIRFFTLALRRDKYTLTAPLRDFLAFSKRRRMIDASVYYTAAPDIVQAELLDRARIMGADVPLDGSLTSESVLGAGQKVRLTGYRNLSHKHGMRNRIESEEAHSVLDTTDRVGAASKPFIYDLEQTPGGCPRMGVVMSCFLRRGELWNDHPSVQRGLCKEEVLSVAGVWSLPEHGVGIPCAFASLLRRNSYHEFSTAECKRLAGNGININVVGTMVMWLLAHLVKKPPVDPWLDSMLLMCDFSENPDEITDSQLD